LHRANIHLDGSKRVIRFREANFEQGEQIALLGVVNDIDNKKKVLKAVNNSVLTTEFFDKKGLADWDRLAWKELTEHPCLLVTDMEKYFQVSIHHLTIGGT